MEQEEFIDGVSSLKSRDNAEATLKDGEAGDQRQQVSGLNFANFNQDYSCISVGYENGFRIFNCDPFNQCYEQVDGSIGIVEMLFSSSLLAIVGTGEQPSLSPRRLKIINTKRHTTICELTFPTSILSIRMNRERLVVLLEEIIYIYDITNMRLLHTIEIPSNPTGLIALSIDVRNNYLAYPSPQKTSLANAAANNINGTTTAMHPAADVTGLNGQHHNSLNVPGPHDNENLQNVRNGDVIIFDCKSLQPITVIDAHKTRLAAMAFSHDGTLIATASDKGTIVRVFSVETGVKLYQFRRGTYNTKIFSLAFSPSNMFLIASSATGTVHVFRLGEEEAKNTIIKSKGSSGWLKPGVKNQTDKNIEAARQSELDKLMKSRQAKLDMLEEDDELLDIPKEDADPDVNGDGGDAHDILQRYKKLQLHSDSEDEIDSSMEDNDAGIVNEGDEEEDEEEVEVEVEEYENVDSLPPLLSEQGSSQSVTSASTATTKAQPIVDTNRRSVARMLRRTSQSLGRKAAEKMGTYLPPKFSSILEPNRHFASLKVPNSVDHMSIVGITESVIESSEPSNIHEELVEQEDNSSVQSTNSGLSSMSRNSRNGRLNLVSRQKLVQIFVISADGMFYNYILDSIRGGDCVLSSQRSLTD